MKSLILAAIAVVLVVAGNAWGGIQYTVTDLGSFGNSSSAAYDVNANGQVVGGSYTGTGTYSHAFLYSDGVMHDLGTDGYAQSVAYGINSAGQVVGDLENYVGDPMAAFLYSNGTMTVLPSMATAGSINDNGQIGGQTSSGYPCVYTISTGHRTTLGSYGGVSDINNNGQAVGFVKVGTGGAIHACLYSNGQTVDLGVLPPGVPSVTDSFATAINASGEVVGWSSNGKHAIIIDGDGIMTDLGYGAAQDINDSGTVVGYCTEPGGAFVANAPFTGGGGNLNSFIDPTSGWNLAVANAISNNGYIVGYGLAPSGKSDAFLLTPISTPEPSTLVLLGIGAISLLGYAWRRRK